MAETKVSDPIITFKNVSKTYTLYKDDKARFKALFFKPRNAKTNKALNNVSMVINRGESVGIVGDNGAGKSTLLKMITGVAFPDEGEITVDGKVAALLELTAGFSMEMTGRENIYLKGYVLGLEDSYIKQIEEKIIDFAELGDYIDQPVRTYSRPSPVIYSVSKSTSSSSIYILLISFFISSSVKVSFIKKSFLLFYIKFRPYKNIIS